MPPDRKFWFPAKHYGWGWGLPVSWQGWLVLAIFLGLLLGGAPIFVPKRPEAYFLYVFVLSVLLTAVAWLKGEPPRWRWGKD
jgi:hypothetical protein